MLTTPHTNLKYQQAATTTLTCHFSDRTQNKMFDGFSLSNHNIYNVLHLDFFQPEST